MDVNFTFFSGQFSLNPTEKLIVEVLLTRVRNKKGENNLKEIRFYVYLNI